MAVTHRMYGCCRRAGLLHSAACSVASLQISSTLKMGGDNITMIKSTKEWHDALAAAGSKAVLVDFYADWCGPCKMIAPFFAKLADQHHEKMVFLKVNVDECAEVAGNLCNITAMPTFQVWKDGQLKETLVGANMDKLNLMATTHA